jgi:hypothetical protein
LNGIDGRENGFSDGSNAGQGAISISIGTPLSSCANRILLSVFNEDVFHQDAVRRNAHRIFLKRVCLLRPRPTRFLRAWLAHIFQRRSTLPRRPHHSVAKTALRPYSRRPTSTDRFEREELKKQERANPCEACGRAWHRTHAHSLHFRVKRLKSDGVGVPQ